jgi:hypothetical protein
VIFIEGAYHRVSREHDVVARSAEEVVPATKTGDPVVTLKAVSSVVFGRARESVVPRCTEEDVGLGASGPLNSLEFVVDRSAQRVERSNEID